MIAKIVAKIIAIPEFINAVLGIVNILVDVRIISKNEINK